MLRDEIDDLYRKSFRSVQDENQFPCSVFDRYEFAKLVAAREREHCAARAAIALLGTLKTTGDRVLHAIRHRKTDS